MARAYIGIGSNLGDRLATCEAAVERIARIPGCAVVNRSCWYRTEPVGVQGQEWYLNGALALDAECTARTLLGWLLEVEKGMGRERIERWGPRTLDLDLLLFGQEIVEEEGLIVPHPLMHRRRFVLVPLEEIAPALLHPVFRVSVATLLEGLPEEGQAVTPWEDERCCA